MSDLGPSKGAHHITENLIKRMSDEQGPRNAKPVSRALSFNYSTTLVSPEKESFLLRKIYSKSVVFFHLNRYCFIQINEHVERNNQTKRKSSIKGYCDLADSRFD